VQDVVGGTVVVDVGVVVVVVVVVVEADDDELEGLLLCSKSRSPYKMRNF